MNKNDNEVFDIQENTSIDSEHVSVSSSNDQGDASAVDDAGSNEATIDISNIDIKNAEVKAEVADILTNEMDLTGLSSLDKRLRIITNVIAVAMVMFHMLNAIFYLMPTVQLFNIHIAFVSILVFLGAAQKEKTYFTKIALIIGAAIALFCAAYIHIGWEGIQMRLWFNTTPELIIGFLLIVISLVGVKFSVGWFMTILIGVIVIYPFFGSILPEPLTTKSFSIPITISNLSIGLTSGLFGPNVRTSAEFIFLFVVFGSILSATGVQKFFKELGKILFKNLVSGPGLMAVLNSALVGSISGSPIANVMITGVYTIPTMKSSGYTKEEAGAIEAAASTGGQIMPPVMGIVAFIMASYTGIPYLKIVKMAIVPAFLYYMGVAIYAHFNIKKKSETIKIASMFKEPVDYRTFFWKMPSFVLSLGLIIFLLARNYTVLGTGFWAILLLIVISMLVPKDLRPKWTDILNGIIKGGKEGASLGIVVCATGMILTSFSASGLAVKLASGITKYSGGTIIGIMLICWVMSILFGMIGVISVAYYMGAAFGASVLIKAGVSLEAAHFFLVFPCSFAPITPPVAMAALVASKLAGGKYIPTAFETVKAAFGCFFIPFMFPFSAGLLLEGSPMTFSFWMDILLGILFVGSTQFAFVGYILTEMKLYEQILLGIAALLVFITAMTNTFVISIVPISIIIFVVVQNILRNKNNKLHPNTAV